MHNPRAATQCDLISNRLVQPHRASSLSTWRTKLRRISRYVNDHRRHPDRDPVEKAIALGMMGTVSLNDPLSKTAALKRYGGENRRVTPCARVQMERPVVACNGY